MASPIDTRERVRHWSITAYLLMLVLLLPLTLFLVKQEQTLNSKASSNFTATAGRPFADNSAWNLPIGTSITIDPNSDAIVAKLATGLHTAGIKEFGVPIFFADASTPKFTIACAQTGIACGLSEQVPIPATAAPSVGTDGQLVVVDLAANKSYELYQYKNDKANATWGGIFPVNGDGIGSTTNYAVGAGVSRLAGVVRTYEIQAGVIDHALVFSTNSCLGPAGSANFRVPATRTTGTYTGVDGIPLGARIQLDPEVNLDTMPGITAGEKAVGKALQKYGAYAVDCGKDPMTFAFEDPTGKTDPYAAAGFTTDHFDMIHLPWNTMRVLQAFDSSGSGLSIRPTTSFSATTAPGLITPTFGVIVPCPSCGSSVSPIVSGGAPAPTTGTGATQAPLTVAPTGDPCLATNTSIANDNRRHHHRKHSGGVSNVAQAILQFLLELLKLLLQLLGGGSPTNPSPVEPSGVVPSGSSPCAPTSAPTTAPAPTSPPAATSVPVSQGAPAPTTPPFTPVTSTQPSVAASAPSQPASACVASGQKCETARPCCTNACTKNINPNLPNDPGTCD